MPKSYLRRFLIGAAILAASTHSALAEYPERQITLVVPFSAGGNTDSIARIVAEHLSEELGQTVVVENRGGGGGTVGSALVAKAKPDGYTLLFGTSGSHSVNPILREVAYDPIKDFAPVSTAVVSSVLFAVHPSVKANTLEELIELTSGGERLNFGSGGVGTLAHVAAELYNGITGSSMIHVPYKGAGQARTDLLAGRIHVFFNNIPTFIAHIETGEVRPLAVAATERSALLPDVPTTAEAGLDDFVMGSWYGLLAPAGTPPETIDRLFAAMSSMDGSAEVRERLAGIGTELVLSESPAAFQDHMRQQLEWWTKTLDNPVFRK